LSEEARVLKFNQKPCLIGRKLVENVKKIVPQKLLLMPKIVPISSISKISINSRGLVITNGNPI